MHDMNILRNKYRALYDIDGISKEYLVKIEHELQIKLPNDFREISSFYSGGDVGGKNIHSFLFSDPTNLIEETLRIREAVDLPNRFVVIAEQAESIIVMDTENKPSIIWIDSVEITKLDEQDFIAKPDVWEEFSDFFNYILDDEEEERKY
ncbi:SMI1/KNR4 family protein [Lysinibacillus sp. G4S2]|uniref:SMI1/KNR4 family protein n=1 Tax=Lysinibacillus sp. G4S2 TaxID=3055859 RepID=UPI0025A0BF61|nr:SMI1/KNR4 family protein [Lysinibacillus sp. G4S2]MDM5247618.1 SMI1/KNR4 family protein [Lysinibacillus sp. G4S2]